MTVIDFEDPLHSKISELKIRKDGVYDIYYQDIFVSGQKLMPGDKIFVKDRHENDYEPAQFVEYRDELIAKRYNTNDDNSTSWRYALIPAHIEKFNKPKVEGDTE